MLIRILIALAVVIILLGIYSWSRNGKSAPASESHLKPNGGYPSPTTKQVMLESMRPIWEKSRLTAITIKAQPTESTGIRESKFFGRNFYLPKGEPIPKDVKNRPMALLAQIDFSEADQLDGFPDSGILQIFIAAYDDLYGTEFEGFSEGFDFEKQRGYEVRFYPEPEAADVNLVTDFSFLPQSNSDTGEIVLLPGETECRLEFSKTSQLATPSDYRFEQLFAVNFFEEFPGLDPYHAMDAAYESTESFGHQIGGYASFTQTDPRSYAKPKKDWLLLLQIDSDNESKIMWGDVGIANFFITPEDLAARDFSKVIYNWDCY